MGLFSTLDISAAGMDVQQKRLEVAAANIANARTTHTAGAAAYQPLEVLVRSSADDLPRPEVAAIVPADVSPRMVFDPGHPDADPKGFVAMPGVDPITSMIELMDVSRGYEANLRAFDVTRSLLQRTLDIGSRR